MGHHQRLVNENPVRNPHCTGDRTVKSPARSMKAAIEAEHDLTRIADRLSATPSLLTPSAIRLTLSPPFIYPGSRFSLW
jgi:hypothetical protein